MDTLRKTTMARKNIDRAMRIIESPGYGGRGRSKNSRANIRYRSSKYRKKGSRKMHSYRKKTNASRRKRFVQNTLH